MLKLQAELYPVNMFVPEEEEEEVVGCGSYKLNIQIFLSAP
jgi:hypothetical protein